MMKLWTVFTVVSAVLGLKQNCPGGTQECPDSATCCELSNKSYGCCPLENAVCCDDHIHCCPANTKCSAGLCINADSENVTAATYSEYKDDVVCPGGEYVCPNSNTCCESTRPGIFVCCRLENAVCCSDKEHCCPQNTTCDLDHKKCTPNNYTPDMNSKKKNFLSKKKDFIKFSSLTKISVRELSVVCPDGSSQCPNGYTCCKMPSGDWGCCPYVNAVCCLDMLHCCPQDMKCDSTSSSCLQGNRNISATLNVLAQEIKKVNLVCPDGRQCSDLMTCCQIGGGQFGCCPFPNAICCEDQSHCCPQNFTCNVKEQRCEPS